MMANILHNEYESDFDTQLAIIEKENEIGVGRAMLALETCLQMQELSYAEAELQCMKESGDFDKLMELYEAAGNQTDDKEKGAISKLFGAIARAFKRIKDFLFGEKMPSDKMEKLKKSNKNIKLAKEDVDNGNKIVSVFNTVKGFFSNAKTAEGNEQTIMQKLGPILTITAATGGGTVAAYKTGQIANLAYNLSGICDFCTSKAEEFTNSESTGAKGTVMKVIGGGLNSLAKVVSAISGAIVKPLQNADTEEGEGGGDVTAVNADALPSDKKELKKMLKEAKSKWASETDPAKKEQLKKNIDTINQAYLAAGGNKKKNNTDENNQSTDQNTDAAASTSENENTAESVEDFFNIEMPDEFIESSSDVSEIYDLIENII